MRSRYKFTPDLGLYFISSSIVDFIPVFISEPYVRILIDSFKYCKQNKGIKIFAYVIMKNHFHLLISGENLSNVVQSIKRHTAREIIKLAMNENRHNWLDQFQKLKKPYKTESNYQVWQEGTHPQFISSVDMLEQKMNYIHNNPVEKGYVNNPEEWICSSARNYKGMRGILDIDELEV